MVAQARISLPSTGTGEPGRRLDMLEQATGRALEDVESTFLRGGKWTLRQATENIAARPWDLLLANPTAAAFYVVLPRADSCTLARVEVKNDSDSTNAITLRVIDDGTIDGASSLVLQTARGLVELFSNGREWKVVASGTGTGLSIQTGTDANTTALAGWLLYMPALTVARTVTAPASPTDGTWFRLLVTNAQTYTVTVDGNGKNIDDRFGGVASTYVISNDGTLMEFVYIAAAGTWMIL